MLNENSVDRKRGQRKGICPDSWLLSRPSASLLFYYRRASTTFKVKGNNLQKRYHALDTIVETGASSPRSFMKQHEIIRRCFVSWVTRRSARCSSFFTIVPKAPTLYTLRSVRLSFATNDIWHSPKSMYLPQLRHAVLSHCSHRCTSNEAYLMRESIDSRLPKTTRRHVPWSHRHNLNVGNMSWLCEKREMSAWQRQRVATSQIELVKNNTCVSFASIYREVGRHREAAKSQVHFSRQLRHVLAAHLRSSLRNWIARRAAKVALIYYSLYRVPRILRQTDNARRFFCPRCYHPGRAISENYGRNSYDNDVRQAKKEEKEKKTEKTYFGESTKLIYRKIRYADKIAFVQGIINM